jgi:predicted anti-sigma-YlaC factor YlaD
MRQPAVRCVEFVESVTDWMEGALVDDDRVFIEEHLAICPHCTEYVEQLRLSRAVLSEVGTLGPRETPPAEARAALLDALRTQRRRDGG